MIAQYTQAALVNECQVLAHPAGAGSMPTSAGMEDFNSMGAWAALKARQIVDCAAHVVAIELVCACQGDRVPPPAAIHARARGRAGRRARARAAARAGPLARRPRWAALAAALRSGELVLAHRLSGMKPTIRRLAELGADERDRLTHRSLDRIFDPALWASVRSIYEDVAAAGDGALCAALQRFDGVDATPATCACPTAELDGAGAKLAPELRDALDSMITALRAYNERVLRDADWREEIAPGVIVGERAAPDRLGRDLRALRQGLVPVGDGAPRRPGGGRGCAAGRRAHAAAARDGPRSIRPTSTSPRSSGCARSGASTARAASPPRRSAAASIPRVRKIVGPGSPAVTVAQLLGVEHGVATNMLQGPSESLILADDSADPVLLALDLLTEAEHGADSAATLVTWSEALAEAVAAAVEPRLAALPRAAARLRRRRHSPIWAGS